MLTKVRGASRIQRLDGSGSPMVNLRAKSESKLNQETWRAGREWSWSISQTKILRDEAKNRIGEQAWSGCQEFSRPTEYKPEGTAKQSKID